MEKPIRSKQMTEAMNFFQSLFSISGFAWATISPAEKELAQALVDDARVHRKEAEAEMAKAEQVKDLVTNGSTDGDANLEIRLTAISVWHFERALRSYRQAAARYNEAGRLVKKKKAQCDAKASALTMQAKQVESAIRSLKAAAN